MVQGIAQQVVKDGVQGRHKHLGGAVVRRHQGHLDAAGIGQGCEVDQVLAGTRQQAEVTPRSIELQLSGPHDGRGKGPVLLPLAAAIVEARTHKAFETTFDDVLVQPLALQGVSRSAVPGFMAEGVVDRAGEFAVFGLSNTGHLAEDGSSWVLGRIDQALAEVLKQQSTAL